MKRAGADFPIRHGRPFTIQEAGHTPTDASDAANQPPAELTIEALRQLPLPPFPAEVDVTTCDVVARIARTGYAQADSDTDLAQLLRFCTKHACADALLWFLLQSDNISFEPMNSDLDPQQVRYLIACLDRLPTPVRLNFDDASDWPEKCWDTFIDALPGSRGIREIIDSNRSFSEQELAQLFAAIEGHPVLCELDIGLNISTATALNAYLPGASTLRKLTMVHHNGKDVALAPDFSPGLLSNRSLTRIELYNWLITPPMAHALAAQGKALTEVLLGCCSFAPGAITAFAGALADNDTMSSIDIQLLSDAVSDMKPIYSVLQSHRSLVSLQISADGKPFTDMAFLWKMLQANLTLCKFSLGSDPHPPRPNEDPHTWSLRPHVRQRLAENRELPLFANQYPMAKLALSILPGNLPHLPQDISAHIAQLLLKTDASALPSYRTLHMLALHREIKSQHKPAFPDHIDLASHPAAQRLARSGRQALPLSPDVMRSIALFCIRHQAADALNWLAVHACKGRLDLQGSRLGPGETGWLIHWTRAAPCPVKLRLDEVALTEQDVADIAYHLAGNHALTALSLKGCAMSTTDLKLLSEALMHNTSLCELLLSEELIAPPTRSPDPFPWPPQRPNDALPESSPGMNELPAPPEPTLPYPGDLSFPEFPVPVFAPQPPGPPAWLTHLPKSQPSEMNPALFELIAATFESMFPRAWPAFPPGDANFHALVPPAPPEVGSLATIAFALRRNNRLHGGDKTMAALLADDALMADIRNPVPN